MTRARHRILLADPDRRFARDLRAALEARGYAVEAVSDAPSALNLLQARPFSGVVVDSGLLRKQDLLAAASSRGRAVAVLARDKGDLGPLKPESLQAKGAVLIAPSRDAGQVADAVHHTLSAALTARRDPRSKPGALEPGRALLLECIGGQTKGRLASRLLAKHSTALVVSAPRQHGEPVTVRPGTRVAVGFPMPDGWYQFESKVLEARREHGEPALVLAQPRVVSHVQRRRYARSRVSFRVQLGAPTEARAATGVDAGEGGMRVMTERALEVGSEISCRIRTGESERPLCLLGTVMWTQELRDNGHRYQSGIEFALPSASKRRQVRTWLAGLGQEQCNCDGGSQAPRS